MNLEGGFESLGRKKGGASRAVSESPEDVLFATAGDGDSVAPNPYGDDDEFDDVNPHGLGPCATFGVAADSAAAPPTLRQMGTPSSPDSDEDALDALLSMGHADEVGSTEPSTNLQIGPPQVPPPPPEAAKRRAVQRPGGGDPIAPGEGRRALHAAAPREPQRRPGAVPAEQPRIPGRDRVSYSKGSSAPAVATVGQTKLQPLPARESGAMSWATSFLFFGAGAAGAAYLGLIVGSAVLAGVSFTLGLVGAMFLFVLFRR